MNYDIKKRYEPIYWNMRKVTDAIERLPAEEASAVRYALLAMLYNLDPDRIDRGLLLNMSERLSIFNEIGKHEELSGIFLALDAGEKIGQIKSPIVKEAAQISSLIAITDTGDCFLDPNTEATEHFFKNMLHTMLAYKNSLKEEKNNHGKRQSN